MLVLGFLLLVGAFLSAHLFVSSQVFAQTPPSTTRTINFSARLKSANGTIAPDGYYNVRFRLYDASQTGSPLWSEVHYDENGVTSGEDYRVKVTNGYLNAKLGSRTVFGNSINWDSDLWLTMEIGGRVQSGTIDGGIPWDGEMTPRIELNAVPYAMSAGSLGGKTADNFVQLGQGAQTNTTDNPSIHINTTGTGNLVQLQRNAEDVFTVDRDGNISFGAGADHTISIAQSEADNDGKTLSISGGDGGSGDTNGGNLVLSGGSGSGSGTDGLVVLTTTAFATATNDTNCYIGGAPVGADCIVSQATVDTSSAVMIGFSEADRTATLPDPTLATPGRIFYVMASSESFPFTLQANDGGTIAMEPNSSQTLLWNGADWVLANGSMFQQPVERLAAPETITITDDEAAQSLAIETPSAPEQDDDSEAASPEDTAGIIRLGNLESAPAEGQEGALPGSMYYDTTLGKVQCYEASGWGACGDAPDTFVAISPEYKNAVMNGTDIGIISSDFCSGTLGINDGSNAQPTVCNNDETYNFYRWTTEEKADQTRSIYLTYQLPDNFNSFIDGSSSIMGRTDGEGATVSYQVYRDNGSGLLSCGSLVTVSNGSQPRWQRGLATQASDPAACNFEAGDSILFRINLTARDKANAYVSNVNFIFRNN